MTEQSAKRPFSPNDLSACPACSGVSFPLDYRVDKIPTNSVRILRSKTAAADVATADMELLACTACGFVWNAKFDPAQVDYSSDYEATQAFSGTYSRFLQAQAREFAQAHGLQRKTIIEIGCGHGEFLAALCEAGENTGIGFDPAFSADRAPAISRGSYEVRTRMFNERTRLPDADFICCRNTLEHIQDVGDFLRALRAAIGSQGDPIVFFQVPSWERIAKEGAFWDVYYEHCSYFTAKSLRALFEMNGFEVSTCELSYGDQYLTLLARPALNGPSPSPRAGCDRLAHQQSGNRLNVQVETWSKQLSAAASDSKRTVLWGGGSKAVALLTTCGDRIAVDGVVDINPHKNGTFLPLSAHRVMAPEELPALRPDRIIILNPIYSREIRAQLAELDIHTEVLELGAA
tara:strand:- start:9247 stop:10458 length:1212 start_codon:yes stop_codon:yes gene_type:complete